MAPPALRVMTYNIRYGRGADDRVDLERIAEVIRPYDADVVGLQEVDVCRARSGGIDQAEALGRRLGLHATFGPCIVRDGGERYGLATLTRWPVESHEVVELPARLAERRSEPRRALVTRLRWPGSERPVVFVNTHLSVLRGERGDQLAALAAMVGDDDGDMIVAGDLNCTTGGRGYRRLCNRLRPATPRIRTWPARLPLVQIDHVLYRGALRPVAGGVWTGGPARRASDHLPVVARFEAVETAP